MHSLSKNSYVFGLVVLGSTYGCVKRRAHGHLSVKRFSIYVPCLLGLILMDVKWCRTGGRVVHINLLVLGLYCYPTYYFLILRCESEQVRSFPTNS
uniref:Uncharacterized protein n=2 Tax=Picea TaxID=3328 RepID=A0A117NJC5_PICGL|nr:hypothetical protein ABT39_MTgene1182 [Picea glauca]QHR91746.1 hypothetical protein Q903MT_gene5782 [Picea sitchensis]